MQDQASKINATFLLTYKGPCVYIWMRGEDYLYIGCSEFLLSRLCRHNIIGIKEPLQEQDILLIYHCETIEKMQRHEKDLIRRYRPKYNTRII